MSIEPKLIETLTGEKLTLEQFAEQVALANEIIDEIIAEEKAEAESR